MKKGILPMSKPSMYKKIVFAVFMLAASGVSARLSALEFTLRPGGFAFFPLGEPSASRYTTGGGGGLALDADFEGGYSDWDIAARFILF
jgi:hypothetical protein